jgi:methylmalonyl-CoA mutase N-terminal domain/subunit
MMFRFHVQGDGSTLTEQQPLNNIVRVALESLASALAGCQSAHACSYDEAISLPSEQAVQLSLRTQQIIAYESGIADTADPLGGSYYLEWLTNKIEEGINQYISTIGEMGGSLEAVKRGYIQREILRSAYDFQKAVDSGEQVVVGVNKFTTQEKPAIEPFEIDEAVEKRQVERLRRLRQERDTDKVKQALEEVREVAKSDKNIMPVLIEAVKTYATVGEISDVMRDVFGEYREPNVV